MQSDRAKARLARVIGPTEVLVGTSIILLADLTDVSQGEALVIIQNNAASASIFFCLSTSATTPPNLTSLLGIPLAAGNNAVLDNIGGLAIWAIAAASQTVGAGTRVTGAKT